MNLLIKYGLGCIFCAGILGASFYGFLAFAGGLFGSGNFGVIVALILWFLFIYSAVYFEELSVKEALEKHGIKKDSN